MVGWLGGWLVRGLSTFCYPNVFYCILQWAFSGYLKVHHHADSYTIHFSHLSIFRLCFGYSNVCSVIWETFNEDGVKYIVCHMHIIRATNPIILDLMMTCELVLSSVCNMQMSDIRI